MKPHKHAELIKAWADGAQIQSRWDMTNGKGWSDWRDESETPEWFIDWEYRIKPEEKKPVVRWLWVYRNESRWDQFYSFMTEKEASLNFENYKHKKLEYTRTEFEE